MMPMSKASLPDRTDQQGLGQSAPTANPVTCDTNSQCGIHDVLDDYTVALLVTMLRVAETCQEGSKAIQGVAEVVCSIVEHSP